MDAEARRSFWPFRPAPAGARGMREPHGPAADALRANPSALAWGLCRTPLLLLLLFQLRDPILDGVERVFDIVWITELVIDVMSTPLLRLGLFAGALAGFAVIARSTCGLSPWLGWLVRAGAGAALILAVVEVTGSSRKIALGLSCVLALNALPRQALEAGAIGRILSRTVSAAPLLGEVMLTPHYLDWLLRSAGQTARARGAWVAAVSVAAVAALGLAVLVKGAAFAPLERSLRGGPDVVVVAPGDISTLQLDSGAQALFASGHGLPRIVRYDLASGATRESDQGSGRAQDVAYDAAARELLLYDAERQAVLVFDADTLALRRTLPTPGLSPGDVWIVAHPQAILLSSEADEQVGAPIVVLDRASGRVLDLRPEQAGSVLLRPDTDVVYLSFFRRARGVLAYDLASRRYVGGASTHERVDRMAYEPRRRELLVPSPVEGRVLRFDATTLEARPPLKGMFGVRAIAVDPLRDLMLVGSLATGRVAAIRLSDSRVLKSWYVGPWLRTIVVDPARGRAFVSSNGALYRLTYAAPLDWIPARGRSPEASAGPVP